MLKAVLTEQEITTLPEPVREHYKKTDSGNFVLDAPIREHPDTLALRNAYTTVQEEAKAARQKLTAFEGIDPSEVETLRRETQLAQREKDLAKGNFEKALTDATREKDEQIQKLLKRVNDSDKSIRKFAITDEATRACIEAGGNPKILLPHILAVADLNDKNEDFVNGPDGKPLLGKDSITKRIREYVLQDLKNDPDWSIAFKPTGARGSEARPTQQPVRNRKRSGKFVENEYGQQVWVSDN